jgi:metal-responsive CopG/Arc/MetJ family transcriptional regulator
MRGSNQKILISLPRKLVSAIDAATTEKQVSRTAFIQESLIRNLHYYNTHERGQVICFQRDDVELHHLKGTFSELTNRKEFDHN